MTPHDLNQRTLSVLGWACCIIAILGVIVAAAILLR